MSERLKVNHPMQRAEMLLQEFGAKHAPIQAFGEDSKIDGLDGRFICSFDPPGTYYILGCDNDIGRDNTNRQKIQVTFWQCPENAQAVAHAIGWDVEKIYAITVDAPNEHMGPVPTAILVMRAA